MPPHSDFGSLTLLFQDEVGGLEIADMSSTTSEASAAVEKKGKFIHVDPKPGTIVVNVGYLLMRWSNGRWKNTVHRVMEPPQWEEEALQSPKVSNSSKAHDVSGNTIPERYSIAYFSAPDPATIVEALPCCYGDDLPQRWKPMNAGEYLLRKRAALYD